MAGNLEPNTQEIYGHYARAYIKPRLGHVRLQQLTAATFGLPDLTLHGLRHTYATASLRAGNPVKVVSERLGHANTAITSDLYQHVLRAMDAEAANTVARLILEGEQQDSVSSAVNPLSTGRPVPDA
jgi:integrase